MRQLWILATMAALATLSPAQALDWPTRPVRIVAPSTPGGAADLFGRLLADHLTILLKQRFYVDNRAGGGGLIGAQIVAHAEPDGYTFVTSSIAYHAIEPAASANPGFDPIRDATHIAYVGGPPNVFIVNPALGVSTLPDLVALAKKKPLDFASPGVGTLGHLLVEEFAREAGIKVQNIPHKGSAQAMLDLLAGNVMFGTMTWSSALGQIRAGKVIPIAVSSKARVAEYPNVPTLAESGYPDLVANTWYALSGPAGVPGEIVVKLNHAVAEVLEMPDVKKRLDDDAIEREPMTPEQVSKFVASEVAKWGPIAKKYVHAP
ncbi:MAG TPA: tripartite tricarboxylate transporter substrate-binding protein [Xanthobacteraceae bacterium]|nr:tripartite tricarboxylate transporter substrate-binding protein [Xanthobacteraceae bacterium]